ncbi:MAG TPA: hydrogenase formation protein, partial [Methyloversatilis sp.]
MSIDQLGGLLQVRPGVARPATLTGTRPDWATTLACGTPADALPALLGTLYSLCGHAHRLCAQAAV